MSRVAVLIPTRGRPEAFQRAVASVRATSKAEVLAYCDDDENHQLGIYSNIVVGPVIGCAKSINVLAAEALRLYPDVDTLMMMPDDAVMETPGWDEYLVDEMNKFPKRIGVVSPHLSGDAGAHRVDMPAISKQLFQWLGWYAHRDMIHYCWPSVIEVMTTGICLTKAPKDKFSVNHINISPQRPRMFNIDAIKFYQWYVWHKDNYRAALETLIA